MQDTPMVLDFTAVTSGGQAFDIKFPLHAETRSGETVANLVSALLETISRATEEEASKLSDGDILQALAMTLAVRARIHDPQLQLTRVLAHELTETAMDAARDAVAYRAARA